MNASVIERTYRRMVELQEQARAPAWKWRRRDRAHHLRKVGVHMALDRNPRMMLFLEKMAEYLRARNDEQLSRIAQHGWSDAHTEYTEFSTVRTAYEKADEPNRDEEALHSIWGWVYAAVAEALGE